MVEVIDDTHLKIKKEFPKKALAGLAEKPAAYKVSRVEGRMGQWKCADSFLILRRRCCHTLTRPRCTPQSTSGSRRVARSASSL